MADHSEALTRVIEFFEQMNSESVNQIEALYDPGAEFRDPFNTVTGHEAIRHIFIDMYEQLEQPEFVVTQAFENMSEAVAGDKSADPDYQHQAFVTWDFKFRFKTVSPGPGPAGPGLIAPRFLTWRKAAYSP